MEVEQHHLTFQFGKAACVAVIVVEGYVDDVYLANLVGIDDETIVPVVDDALVAHAFDSNVVQVLSSQRLGIVGIPVGCYGSENLNVLRKLLRIEEHEI